MNFSLEAYATQLRDRCTGGPAADIPDLRTRVTVADDPGTIPEVAYLLACGLLDARFDCLLLPVLVAPHELALLPDGLGWPLPPGFLAERLASGACLILVHSAGIDDRATIDEAAARWPRCRFLVARRATLQSSLTCPSSS